MATLIGCTKKPLVFKVRRRGTEVITPATPTPYEFKELSDIDDQEGLRFLLPLILFYRKNDGIRGGDDPAKVVKEAISKALVPYYPFAGRLREKQGRKLVVECNGEGILFTEAIADVSLDDFGDPLHPPFPCLDQLLYDPLPIGILDSPFLVMQVTKVKCGGFIIAIKVNHTMSDGQGMGHLLRAITEMAVGAQSTSIQPVWARHLLQARDPPTPTFQHHEYEQITFDAVTTDDATVALHDHIIYNSFYFGPKEISALKRFIPPHLKCSTFEIISACVWRCHTISLRLDPKEIVTLLFLVDARSIMKPALPSGYYGNVITFPMAFSTAEKLSNNPVSYAVELVKKVKNKVNNNEYMMSLVDLLVIKGRPMYCVDHRTFFLSDTTKAQAFDFDFGWGQPVYCGPAETGIGDLHGGFYSSYADRNGGKGIVISICLPKKAMDIFVDEMSKLLCNPPSNNLIRCLM